LRMLDLSSRMPYSGRQKSASRAPWTSRYTSVVYPAPYHCECYVCRRNIYIYIYIYIYS
jgi:hypothetical protein